MITVKLSERKIRAIIETLEHLGLKSLTRELRKALKGLSDDRGTSK